MGDCCGDESGICSIKTNNLNGKKHRWDSNWKQTFTLWRLSSGLYKENEFIPKCSFKELHSLDSSVVIQ